MPFLTPNCITDQETSPLVAFYNRQDGHSTILNLAKHGCMHKISGGETLSIRTMFH